MTVTVSVLADRPDLVEPLWNMHSSWPTFMTKDPIGSMYFDPAIFELFADHVLVCQEEAGAVVGKAVSIPFHLPDATALPADGWDGAIRRGISTRLTGETANVVSALEISLTSSSQGRNLSMSLLAALRDNAGRQGFSELVAPLRPNGRTDLDEPIASYIHRTRPDGLPIDPWLRVHVRAGGRIDSVAPRSMVVPGTLDEWREWTGLPFDRSGPVHVPGALVPVIADVEQGTAVYTEPNVCVRHPTAARPRASSMRSSWANPRGPLDSTHRRNWTGRPSPRPTRRIPRSNRPRAVPQRRRAGPRSASPANRKCCPRHGRRMEGRTPSP